MLRVLAVLLVFCGTALSEESSPRESESKAQAAETNNQHGETTQQSAAPTALSASPVINIYTAKHAGEESHCAQSWSRLSEQILRVDKWSLCRG
jgi:hypothetical protein